MAEAKTQNSPLVTYVSIVSLVAFFPPSVILIWYTMAHADRAVSQTWDYLKQHGVQGFINIWPRPTATAWKIIACFVAFEAALQLFLPGKRVEGPISPQGNRPVYKGRELYPRIVVFLITKFFCWEAGNMSAMDIAHDRGSSILLVWNLSLLGFLVWLPCAYSSPGMYLVNHPVNLRILLSLSILVAGFVCLFITYDCDRQKQEFRRSNGKCLIWGEAPSKIVASYTTTFGETKTSLLLISGWWGVSHHFHYLPDLLTAFLRTVPALFTNFLPYFSSVFQVILLFDRAKRDDDRCQSKYGKYWKLYCKKVPYLIIPGIY